MPSFWKQLTGHLTSISTDALGVEKTPSPKKEASPTNSKSSILRRPNLTSKAHSFSIYTKDRGSISGASDIANGTEYKTYRDKFLSDRYTFTGRVFGVSLKDSLSTASTDVMVQSESMGFGRVPIVVAKCGAYLKANALETSGIFRITGNNKRVKELQHIFSTNPDYGMKFKDWESYSVHDFASLLRRYLNNLEQPLIPLELYDQFREPLKIRPRILKHLNKESVSHPNADKENKLVIPSPNNNEYSEKKSQTEDLGHEGDEEKEEEKEEESSTEAKRNRKERKYHKKKLTKDIRTALKEYEKLFIELSPDSKHLTLYLLDLLSLFDRKSDISLMTAKNLSAIFQPSILSHPDHDMEPKEYALSRLFVEFLIEYSYKLVPFMLKKAASCENSVKATPLPSKVIPETIIENVNESDAVQNKDIHIIPQSLIITNENNESIAYPSTSKKIVATRNLSSLSIDSISSGQKFPLSTINTAADSSTAKTQQSSLQVKRVNLMNRPHSKSFGSTTIPQDVIPSNTRRSRLFSWIHKPNILSESGDLTATEEEADTSFDEGDISISGSNAPLVPSSNVSPYSPVKDRSISGSSTFSFNTRPLPMILGVRNRSTDELEQKSLFKPIIERKSSRSDQVSHQSISTPTSQVTGSTDNTNTMNNSIKEMSTNSSTKSPVRMSSIGKEAVSVTDTNDLVAEIKRDVFEDQLSKIDKRQSWFQRLKSSSRSINTD